MPRRPVGGAAAFLCPEQGGFRSVRSVSQDAASVPGPATTAPPRRRATRAAAARTTLRPWQQRAVSAMADWLDGPFLVAAAPGAGKTVPALHAARQLLR